MTPTDEILLIHFRDIVSWATYDCSFWGYGTWVTDARGENNITKKQVVWCPRIPFGLRFQVIGQYRYPDKPAKSFPFQILTYG